MLLLPPALPPGGALVPAEDFVSMLDDALVPVSLAMRDLVARRDDARHTRIVVLIDGAVTGPAGATPATAAMGGLLGLARSWALEFAPLLVTVNVVVAGVEVGADLDVARMESALPPPDAKALAHAVSFFLHPEAGSITGQVLTVCGGRLAGLIPV
jgi:NAD(P)-dependent dehydrogenase (short-subunit alcohol dehydrogenase family)